MMAQIDNQVRVQGIPASELAKRFGTPLFVYDGARIRDNFTRLDRAFAGYPRHRIYYSLKANPSLALAAFLRSLGAGADTCSLAEILTAERAGFEDSEIALTACSFSAQELAFIAGRRLDFNLDSLGQLLRYGQQSPVQRRIGVRVNPGVGAGFLGVCIGGGPESKFGIALNDLGQALKTASAAGLEIRGLHFHVGSGNLSPTPILDALAATLAAVPPKLEPEYVDTGGGLGIPYASWLQPLDVDQLACGVIGQLRDLRGNSDGHVALYLSPGEYLVGDAGYLLTRVRVLKKVVDERPDQPPWRHYAITDTSTNHLFGAGLYGTHFPITVDGKHGTQADEVYEVVGNLNQSQDCLASARVLPRLEEGDLLVIGMAGAYASSRLSRFNGRLAPAEVLILDGEAHLVRERETAEVACVGQRLPPQLSGELVN